MAMMVNNAKFDTLNMLSILNQNRTSNRKEVQRTTTTSLNINDAIDNVSAYSIAESLRIRTRVLNQVTQSLQNDTALLKTAQSSGESIVDSIKEIQRLAISATDENITDDDRLIIQKDINRLVNQISESAQVTFNGRNLIDGSATTGNQAIATVLSNNSLYSGTTAATALTDLKNSNGVSLEIDAANHITASYVKDGNIYTTSFSVGGNTVEDIFKKLNAINGITLTDAAFVGGGSGILAEPIAPTKPQEPEKPIAPVEPIAPDLPTINMPDKVEEPAEVSAPDEEVFMPAIPSEFVPAYEPIKPTAPPVPTVNEPEENIEPQEGIEPEENIEPQEGIEPEENAESNESATMTDEEYATALAAYEADMAQYEIDKTAYDAIQAGTATIIQKPIEPDESATPEQQEQFAEQQAQYEADLAAYNDAVNNYSAQMTNYIQYRKDKASYEQYQKDLANYNQYLIDKAAYDEEWANYNAALEQYQIEAAAYPTLVRQYEADMDNYENNLYPKYLEDMETYRKDYAQYQEDMANYRLMIADIVKVDDNGLSVTARKPGLEGQISGVSINVADSSGKANLTANAALNNFKTTTFAADEREDNSINFLTGETIGQMMNFGFDDMRSEAFGLKSTNGNIISISTKADADAALATIENALSRATEHLQTIGSSEKKLGYIADSLSIEINNIQEPDSLIRNAGMAKTFTLYALDIFNRDRTQSMFAMANQHSSSVLALLR